MNFIRRLAFLYIAGLATSCSSPKIEAPSGIKHVVLIGIDGLSTDGLMKANTPFMDSLIGAGVIVRNVRTVLPSVSSPNWASMITGSGPEQHGVTTNDWTLDEAMLKPVVQDNDGYYPSIFHVIREQLPEAEIGSVYNWKGFGRLYNKKDVSYDDTFSSPDTTTTAFVEYMVRKKPLFAFIHLDHVDEAGHHYGHGSTEYFSSIMHADSLVGQVMQGLRVAGMEKNTLILLTSDHGGIGYGHGGETKEETTVPLILCGKGIKQAYQPQQQVYTYDVAATIAFALGVEPPYSWIGRPVKAAFSGYGEPINGWEGKKVLTAPVIHPERKLYQQAGALFIDKPAEVKMDITDTTLAIRYTLDGSAPNTNSPRYTEPFLLDSTSVVKARSFDINGNESPITEAYFRVLSSGQPNGVYVSYYRGNKWKQLPLFSKLKEEANWRSFEFQIDSEKLTSLLSSGNSFGLQYSGYLRIDTAGEYTFYTQSDDGSKLYIDEKEVVDNDGGHGVIERAGSIHLSVGMHPIQVLYFNEGGGYWLDAFYKGPGLAKQLIPANKLFLKRN